MAIAMRLRERGYDVVIATGPQYRENVTAEGIGFHPVGPTPEQLFRDLKMDIGEFGRKVSEDTLFILEGAVFPYLRSMYDELAPAVERSALVLSSPLLYSARFAAERYAVPHLTVALQPLVFVSAYDPPCAPQAPWVASLVSKLGRTVTSAVYGAVKRLVTRRARALFEFHRTLGLPDTGRNLLFEGQFSPYGTLATYSSLLAAVQPDYPPNTTVTGFTFYDRLGDQRSTLSSDLHDFLSSGPPPLVFTLGSFAVDFPGDFYLVSRDVARRLRRRVVLVVGSRYVEKYGRDGDVFVMDYARFSDLFPRALAIIHHGGIGTTGQALRSGKPQLVVPVLGDQFDNAARVVRLGVGRSLRLTRYRASAVEAELSQLLNQPHYAARASTVGSQVGLEDGAAVAARVVDSLLASTA
jgi:UDP:flavonoid glycosyltransferase YjiC (YdhE family)